MVYARETPSGNRLRAEAEGRHPRAPEGLVYGEWDDDGRDAGAERRTRGARTAVVDDGRNAREQPVVRQAVGVEHVVGPVDGLESAPPSEQHRPNARATSFVGS